MENFDFPKQSSEPPLTRNNSKSDVSKNYASVTHPSVCTQRREHLESIFKKINSDDNVLSRIPTRLDPNVEFSDDEDEEPPDTVIKKPTIDCMKSENLFERKNEKENQKKSFPESVKTPAPPHRSRQVLNDVFCMQEWKTSEIVKNHPKNILPNRFPGPKNDIKRVSSQLLQVPLPKEPSKCFLKPSDGIVPSIGSNQNRTNLPNKKSVVTDKSATITKSSALLPNENLVPSINSTQNPTNLPNKKSVVTEKSVAETKSFASLPNEMIEVNNKLYNVLSLLGSGGSCKVYSVYDTQDKVRVAIKRVNLKNTDPLIRKGYQQEIEYLKKLQNSNRVIKMYDYEYREDELLLVLEHGDIDLSKYLSNEARLKRLTPLKIKFYWAQMLEAVAEIHLYGIVHSDLKPANFLLVEGNLKLIDFGIATSVPEDKTSTFRDTQVGTLNYMSPEAITQMSADSKQPCFKIGVKSDVWSLGCILYNLVYGVTPFHNVKSLLQKIYAITNPNYEIPFKPISDPLLLDVLKSCLKRNPKERASVEDLLHHPFLPEENFTSSAVPVHPSQDLQNVLKQMQVLTPRRMRYITQVVQELTEKSDA